MQISCWSQCYREVPARFKGFLDRPRPSGGGNHCSFSMGSLQNRAPPELAFQQPIQDSSVAQRPELVTRSLA